MPTIGDCIMGLREAAVDVPQSTLAPPGAELTVALSVVASCTIPAGNYFCKTAYRTPWGETLPSAESGPFVVDATHGLQITGTIPLGVSEVVLYIGTAAGAENYAFASGLPTLPFIVSSPAQGYSDTPTIRNTAFMPDGDGKALSAFAIYRWLNDGLENGAAICGGGIPDISGIASVATQGIYTIPGNWWKIDKAWYDGYPMGVSGLDTIFRKNRVTGSYAMSFVISHVDDRMIVETWPQSARSAGVVTLTPAITATQTGTIATAAGATNFVLPMGLAQLGPDSFGNTEIVYYSQIAGSTSMTIVVRGLGGTVPRAWVAGTAVTELNIFFHGLRVPPRYKVGQANSTLNVPPSWKSALDHYLLHRYRTLEKDDKRAQQEYAQFKQILESAPLNKPVGGPRQIQIGGGRGVETMPGVGSYFGGVLVP